MFSRNGYEHGRLFHHVSLISLALIFFASLVLFILSIYYYNQMIVDHSFASTSQDGASLFLYLVVMPILTLTQTLIQLLLSNRSLYLTPRAMVATGSIFLVGWIVVASIWTDCEIILPNSDANLLPHWCPHSAPSSPAVSGVVFEKGLATTKDALGWIVTLGYVVYLVSASIGWREEKMEEKNNNKRIRIELESF